MVARSESMFGCYDSYSYRLWSLANAWTTCQFPSLANGIKIENEDVNGSSDYYIKCPQCQKGYQTFQGLKEHMESSHPDLAVVENGTTTTTTSQVLTPTTVSPPPSALTTNNTGGPLGCSQCAASFTSKDQLEKHELLHSPNAQASCKICNKTFANVYRLQRHKISHEESAVLRKFKCNECDKAFKFKHHLKEHIRIHSGEKPFECGNCGKRFSHSGSYSSHMTSKKCLVMNLKLGRTRIPSNNSLLDKNPNMGGTRGPKRANTNPLNNNITTSPNHNAYLPILPKYTEAAAAFLQSSLANTAMHPFYLAPPSMLNPSGHAISPYTVPNLGHLLEQLQSASPHRPPILEQQEPNLDDLKSKEIPTIENIKQEQMDESNKSHSSSCSDLVMDEETDHQIENIKEEKTRNPEQNGNDLEAVKRILETVNATVTKQFLQANMQKYSDNSSDCQSVASVQSPLNQTDYNCTQCKRTFASQAGLDEHECAEQSEVKSEGLAAKLEDALTTKSDDNHGNDSGSAADEMEFDKNHERSDEYEMDGGESNDQLSEDGRKVRVRSLISEEQLKVLKDNYAMNPRPKREELIKIAEKIGFPVRVVQVWFQNTRARDRREGRLIQVPYSSTSTTTIRFPPSIVPSQSPYLGHKPYPLTPSPPQYTLEQPLDLSFKKDSHSHDSSPATSPRRPASEQHHYDSSEDAVNLSQRSSRSPTPFQHIPYPSYQQNSNPGDPHRTPSPLDFNNGSRLAQILAQPAHKLGLSGMGLMPIDRLMQYSGADLPSLSQIINNRITNLSPNSEKRKWNENCESSTQQQQQQQQQQQLENLQDDDLTSNNTKRAKATHLVIKGLNSPMLSNPDGEIEGQFSCDQCDKAFSKQSSLARHKYEHSGQRPHKCNECPKAFKHKHHLTEHKRLHSGEKPFQCSKCLKRFSHSGSYSQHMNHRYSYCKPYRE